ncbi:MAG: TetR/AcrR family transcriptional regulator [Eubacteriales bacterium]|nr:TetR/AcrR family transcriptional regulator [Eubacteriales bacterium]
MASERFMKLPEDKKEKIIAAAMHEYCNEPLEAVSINRIIKEAGISRGSFYTYFEDKQDLLCFLGEVMRKTHDEVIKDCVRKANGDFFAAMDLFLDACLKHLRETKIFRFQKNVAIHANINPMHAFEHNSSEREKHMALAEWIYENADISRLCVKDAGEMLALMMCCYMNLMIAVVEICQRPENAGPVMEDYRLRMRFVKEGALKHE